MKGRFRSRCQPRPVAANQVVGDGPTKMIGAMHGAGRLTCASIFESPVVVAGKGAVATLAVAGAPPLIVVQLTIATKLGIGFVPCSAAGTGAASSRTSRSDEPIAGTWSDPKGHARGCKPSCLTQDYSCRATEWLVNGC